MTLTKQNSDYISYGFSKMKTKEDFLVLVNYAKGLILSNPFSSEWNRMEWDLIRYDDGVLDSDARTPFKKKPIWFTWETGKNEKIYLGWSCKELVDWCNNPVNKDVHPFRDARYLDKMITPFKHCIEVRKGKLDRLFNQVIDRQLKEKFEVTYFNLNKATFLTDVNVFQSGLMYLFSPFLEIADDNKEYRVEIAFKTEKVANYRLKIITITHHNSLPNKRSDDEDLLKGDLNEAKERFRNLCNWSIEAKFDDGFKRVHILNDNPNVPKIETIEKSEVGFTHVLSFY